MSDGNVKIGVEIDEADVKASLNRIEGNWRISKNRQIRPPKVVLTVRRH